MVLLPANSSTIEHQMPPAINFPQVPIVNTIKLFTVYMKTPIEMIWNANEFNINIMNI